MNRLTPAEDFDFEKVIEKASFGKFLQLSWNMLKPWLPWAPRAHSFKGEVMGKVWGDGMSLLMGVLVWSSISSLHFIRLLGVSLLNDCQSRLRTRLLSCEMTIRPPNRAGRKDSSNSQPLFLLWILSQDFWNPLPCLCVPTTRLDHVWHGGKNTSEGTNHTNLNEKFDISVPSPQESSPSLRIAHAGGLLHYHRAVSSWAWKWFTMVGQWGSSNQFIQKT